MAEQEQVIIEYFDLVTQQGDYNNPKAVRDIDFNSFDDLLQKMEKCWDVIKGSENGEIKIDDKIISKPIRVFKKTVNNILAKFSNLNNDNVLTKEYINQFNNLKQFLESEKFKEELNK